jgi:formyltetrahydrofolate deformylase
MNTAVLLLHCPDAKGLVYHVSRFIYEYGGNILDAAQHKEELDDRFFMRVHFDTTDLSCTRAEFTHALGILATRFAMETRLSFSDQRKRMLLLVSKYDHCLYDLCLRHQYGELPVDIPLVLSNHPDLAPVCARFKLPFDHFPASPDHKAAAEEKILAHCATHQIDFIVLARYMQILSHRLIHAYRNRIINVHHGFLPAFKGARPYHQAYEHGVKLIGATSHYATEDLDMGPIIEQETVRVHHGHSVADLVALGRDLERQVLARAVRAHAEDRIIAYRRRTIVFP